MYVALKLDLYDKNNLQIWLKWFLHRKVEDKMDVRWSKGCDIPTSKSSHVQPLSVFVMLLYLQINWR